MRLSPSLVAFAFLVACCLANTDLKTGLEILENCYKASNLTDDLLTKSKESITRFANNMKSGEGTNIGVI